MNAPRIDLPRIGLLGRGRLATALVEALPDAGYTLAWQIGRGEDLPRLDIGVDVVIDASIASAVEAHVAACLARRLPLVIAATGWHLPDLEQHIGQTGAVLAAPNGSLTLALLRRFATVLGAYTRQLPGAEGFLLDHHHAAKRDAPSGTATMLAEAWRHGAGREPVTSCLRAGHEIGSHTLGFDAPSETLEIRHRARSRALFADGLLKSAAWLHARWSQGERGLFTLDDVAAAMLDPLFEPDLHVQPDLHAQPDLRIQIDQDLQGDLP